MNPPPAKRMRLGLQIRPILRAPASAIFPARTTCSIQSSELDQKIQPDVPKSDGIDNTMDVNIDDEPVSVAGGGAGARCARAMPFRPVRQKLNPVAAKEAPDENTVVVRSCMWTKDMRKKKKKYDDGILVLRKNKTSLFLIDGKLMTERGVKVEPDIKCDEIIYLNNVEIEIGQTLPTEDFLTGKCFSTIQPSSIERHSTDKDSRSFVLKRPTPMAKTQSNETPAPVVMSESIPSGSFVVRPSKGEGSFPIYVDPMVSKVLKPHQKEGITFMYDCLTSKSEQGINGCIVADEMGLGKTLMTISLIHTMLKRGENGKPMINKVLILAPASVVPGWMGEIRKWFASKLTATAITSSSGEEFKTLLAPFKVGYHPLLMMSYEMYRNNYELVNGCKIDLVVCDEGHKLKGEGAQIKNAIAGITTLRRIVLSGTPIQNDLGEFYNICNFVNPNVFGPKAVFRNCFLKPMGKKREGTISESEKELMEARQEAFFGKVKQFLLRRTHESVNSALPERNEFLIFVKLSDLQIKLYKLLLASKFISNAINGTGDPLTCMGMIVKLMAHPSILHRFLSKSNSNTEKNHDDEEGKFQKAILELAKPTSDLLDCEISNKILILKKLLASIKSKTNDKVIIVSNYTQILDCVGRLCDQQKYKAQRFDGSLTIKKREAVMNQFNDPTSDIFILLLSCKAGATGTTLIGANRIVLFDPDWNPASDAQAMGRIWRHGQKKICYIYRFFSCGSLEEKILQRQKVKLLISTKVIDSKEDTNPKFSSSDLRKVFSLNEKTACDTFPKEAEESARVDKEKWECYEKDEVLQDIIDECYPSIVKFIRYNDPDLCCEGSKVIDADSKIDLDVKEELEGEEEYIFAAEDAGHPSDLEL